MSLGISYKISAVDEISRIVDKIARKTHKLDDNIEHIGIAAKKTSRKFSAAFKKMSRSTGFLSGKLKGLAVAGAAFFGIKDVFKKGMEFEDSMAAVAAITGAAGAELKGYSDTAIKLSKKYGIAAAEIATGLKDIASGKSELLDTPDKLKEITDKAVELSRAAGITVPSAVKAMVSGLNQFGKGAESAAMFADILTQGSVVGASEIADTAEAMKNAGSIASAAGLDFLETNAALQAMSKSALKGAEAGTGLAGVIRFIKKKLPGLDIKELGFEKTLSMIAGAAETGALDLTATFGEHEKSILALIANFEHFKRFKKDLKKSAGATTTAADIRMNTTSVKLEKLRQTITEKMIGLFHRMEPALSKMTVEFTNWLDSISESDIDGFMETLKGVGSILKGIGKTIQMVIKGWKEIYGLVSDFRASEQAKLDKAHTTVTRDFTQEEIRQMMSSSTPTGGGGGLESELPPGWGEQKTTVDVNINAPEGMVQSVKQKTALSGSGQRKSKTKSNMSGS